MVLNAIHPSRRIQEPLDARRIEHGGMLVRERVYPHAFTLDAHDHDVDVLSLSLDDGWWESCDGRRADRSAGQLSLLPSAARHVAHFPRRPAATFLIELPREWSSDMGLDADVFSRPQLWRANSRMARTLARLRAQLWANDVEADDVEAAVVSALTALAPQRPERAPPWLGVAREHLHDCFMQRIAIRRIAAACGVRPASLARAFRRHYGCTPSDFARRLRLEWAAAELRSTQRGVSEIAHDAQFADHAHFSRQFKRAYGVPPQEYRRAK